MLKETVELVGPGDVGVVGHNRKPSQTESVSSSSSLPIAERRVSGDSEGERAGLRQRLAAVIGSSAHS